MAMLGSKMTMLESKIQEALGSKMAMLESKIEEALGSKMVTLALCTSVIPSTAES